MKCTRCSNEITIKTDPQNSDYVCEIGAVRNYESTITKESQEKDLLKKQRQDEEEGNAMKALENRTMDNKMEMDILDGLDEIRTLNARMNNLDPLQVIEQRAKSERIRNLDDEERETLELLKYQHQQLLPTETPPQPMQHSGEFPMPPAPKARKSKIAVSKIGPKATQQASNPFGLDY